MTSGFALPDRGGDRFWFLGTTMILKATAKETGGAFTLLEQTGQAGFETPPHVHQSEDEAFYVLEGAIQVQCGNESWEVGAGGFAFLPKGIAHAFKVTAGPSRLLQVTSPAGFERFVEDVGVRAGSGNPPPPAEAEIQRLMAAAPKHGLTLLPPK
ncbi:MAG: quercetin 2,3-dioxygenase [Hyphomicrobiales bacterium]